MRLKDDLAKILAYVETIKKVDVTGIEPLVHSVEAGAAGNVWRDDKSGQGSLPADERHKGAMELRRHKALQNAPKRRANFFEVPRVIE